MKYEGRMLKEVLRSLDIDVKDFAKEMNISRQAAVSYFDSKKFQEKTLDKILNVLKITKYEFQNASKITSKTTLNESPEPYGNNLETLKILQKQLNDMNKMLEKALDNESKLLDLLEKRLS